MYIVVFHMAPTIFKDFLSIIVNDDFEEVTIDTIIKAAGTEVGDGKIFGDIKEAYKLEQEKKEDSIKLISWNKDIYSQ